MGWDFTHNADKFDIIQNLIRRKENKSGLWETIDHAVRGNVLWMIEQYTDKDLGNKDVYIVCALLKNQPGYGWGYKDMTESQHPYYYSCPLMYLDFVSKVTCQEWRDKVRQYHAEQTAKKQLRKIIQVGDLLTLKGCKIPHVKITNLNPLRGTYQNVEYRIPPRFIHAVRA